MNNVLEKGNIIAKIRKGEDLDQIIDYVKSEIYRNGPNSSVGFRNSIIFQTVSTRVFQEIRARNHCYDGAVFQTAQN